MTVNDNNSSNNNSKFPLNKGGFHLFVMKNIIRNSEDNHFFNLFLVLSKTMIILLYTKQNYPREVDRHINKSKKVKVKLSISS